MRLRSLALPSTLSIGAWAGTAAGCATALADFGAHWLYMESAADRAWLGLRLLSLQAAAGALLGLLSGLLLGATGLLGTRLATGRKRLWLQSALIGVLGSPAAIALARLLWSGGKMSRVPGKSVLLPITALCLLAGGVVSFWLGARLFRAARGALWLRARSVLLAAVLVAFALGKLNQLFLPNLYDYLHTSLSLAAFGAYALGAGLAGVRAWDRDPRAQRVLAAGLPCALLLGLGGYGSLCSLDGNQNVRVALSSANMPHSRALLSAAAPLLPRVDAASAALAKQRAAAARVRRAEATEDGRLLQLPDAHVLLITVDALRADHLGSYGYARSITPALDALAAQGALFEHAYAQAPHSSYSLCSLLTSEYLHETTELGAAPPERSLPGLLADSGYHTAAFYTQGIFHTAAERLGVYERTAFGFALHDHQDRPAEQMTDRVLSEIDRTLTRGEPSSLFWVHYFDVHEPYEATTLGTSDLDRYDSELMATDAAIGRLVREARARLKKPVVVVVTADHGEEFHEHGGVYHGSSLYEEQVHVPLLLAAPGIQPHRYVQPVESVDIVPTLLGLLGIDAPPTLRGSDLRQLLADPTRERGPVFSAVIHKKMVVSWPYKLIADLRFGSFELYQLDKDPLERDNRADHEPARVAELRGEIYAWLDALAPARAEKKRETQALEWGRLGDRRAVEPLSRLLTDDAADAAQRCEAAQLLGKLADPAASQSLLAATHAADAWVVAEAAIALGRMFDERAAPALRRLVSAEDPGIRSRAAVSLARLRDPLSVPALIDALWIAPNPYEREEAVRWLGRLGDASALDPLLNLLPEAHTRHLVVVALGELGDARAFAPLVHVLSWDRNTNVRDGAVRALSMLGDPRAVPVVLPLVGEDPALRNSGEALVRLRALERHLIGGTDVDAAAAHGGTGIAGCRRGPLRHDWDFLHRTYCRTERDRASLRLAVPRAVSESPYGSTLLISLRRSDATARVRVQLRLGERAERAESSSADGVWNEQRFSVPKGALHAGTVRLELQVEEPGARLEIDHALLVPKKAPPEPNPHAG